MGQEGHVTRPSNIWTVSSHARAASASASCRMKPFSEPQKLLKNSRRCTLNDISLLFHVVHCLFHIHIRPIIPLYLSHITYVFITLG